MSLVELDVNLNDEARAMREMAMKFALEVLRPAGVELDRLDPADAVAKGSRLFEVISKHRELGFHKRAFAGEFGGIKDELDQRAGPLIAEALGYGDAGLALGLESAALAFETAAASGGSELKEWVRSFCEDDKGQVIGCVAELEPGTSGVAALEGDELVIKGCKASWVLNGPIATHALALVKGQAAALVPLDLPGIERGKPLAKLGQRPLCQCDISFREVKVPKKYVITTDPKEADALTEKANSSFNLLLALVMSGLAQAALDEALGYSKERIQGGVPIAKHNNIKLKLFSIFSLVESSRALARRVAAYASSNGNALPGAHAAAARVVAGEAAFKVASEAIQVLGGNGLALEYATEKMFRDARVSFLQGGANDQLALKFSATL